MKIGKAIYKILHDNIAVESMVQTRIAPNVMKQTTQFPFIVYDVSNDTPEGNKSSIALLDTASIMISVYSKGYSEASKLANYVRTALDRVNGVFNTVDIQAINFDGYDDIFEDMSGSDGVYRKALNFNIRIINSFNNIYSTHFDGVDDFVSMGVTGMSSVKTTGSISSWVKLETIGVSGNVFQVRQDSDNNIALIYVASSNELRVQYKGGGSSSSINFATTIENDGNWHHLATTWDTGGDELKLYLDGTLVGTTTGLTPITGSFTTSSIGSNSVGGAFWKGNIDEVVLFNKTLTGTEVSNLYNDGMPYNPQPITNMIGYWQMGEGGINGTPIAIFPTIGDVMGNNNGTMTNMTSTDFKADVPE